MKKALITLLAAICLLIQPLLATSVMEGREQKNKVETSTPHAHPEQTRAAPEAEMTRTLTTRQEFSPARSKIAPTHLMTEQSSPELVRNETADQNKPSSNLRKNKRKKIRILKLFNRAERDKKRSAGFGIAALAIGVLGFFTFWTAGLFLAPVMFLIGLFMAVAAIVFGAIGMARNRRGRGFAIAGLVMGLITLVVPIALFVFLIFTY